MSIRAVGPVLVVSLCVTWLMAPQTWAERPAPELEAGRAAYEQQCARCHGVVGKGDGRDAKRLYPKPRDLASGVFKFRTTASGSPPTDEDLFRTITDGLPGSGMPDWRHLDESTRWQLVEYVKHLAPVFQERAPEPIPLGDDPGPSAASLEQGRQVYEKLGCAACHGVQGRGNGPSTMGLVDNWDNPIRAADLTQGWAYRSGRDVRSIATRIMTGIDGAPMPSYAEAVAGPEEVWQLAYYVHSLQRESHWNMIAHARSIDGALPSTPDDPRWQQAELTDVRLHGVIDREGSLTAPPIVIALSLQPFYNAEALALRISWHDPSEDSQEPADALAVVFRPIGLGDSVSLQTWPIGEAPALDLCVWSAATPHAQEAVAKEFEGLLGGASPGVRLVSEARYDDGEWAVVIQRPLHVTGLPAAVVLTPEEFFPIAFSVRDGSGIRTVSAWIDLVLQPSASPETAPSGPGMSVWLTGIILVIAVVSLWLATRRRVSTTPPPTNQEGHGP